MRKFMTANKILQNLMRIYRTERYQKVKYKMKINFLHQIYKSVAAWVPDMFFQPLFSEKSHNCS